MPSDNGALTELQEAFAAAYAANGGKGRAAAVEAGYAPAGARVQATRNLSDPRICGRILEHAVMRQARAVAGAQSVIERLSLKAKSEYVQLEASKDILTRAGIAAPVRVAVAGQVSIHIDLGE